MAFMPARHPEFKLMMLIKSRSFGAESQFCGGNQENRMHIKSSAASGIIGTAMAMAIALPAHAQTAQMQQTAQCILSATKDTRSPLAVQLLQKACNDSVVFTGKLYENQQRYDQCLIQNLSGAQSDEAANQIQSACRTLNPRS